MKKLFVAAVAGALLLGAAPTANAATSRTIRIAALGDSYASGTGAGDYEAGTEGICWRSNNSSSAVNVAALRAAGLPVDFANATCSGATIQDLHQPFKGQPAQLNVLRSDTDIVQLTVGASDIAFAGYGGLCIQSDCSGAPTDAILSRLPALTQSLTTLLGEIKSRSPRARIVLAAYGRQLNPGPNPAGAQLDPICGDGVISSAERLDGNRVSSGVNEALRTASRSARARGVNVVFVSPYQDNGDVLPAFAGHSLCEAGTPYYRGLEALAPGQEGPDAVLHLNSAGQAAMADLIAHKVLTQA
jgi:lysophospholipase L1-like esterase